MFDENQISATFYITHRLIQILLLKSSFEEVSMQKKNWRKFSTDIKF